MLTFVDRESWGQMLTFADVSGAAHLVPNGRECFDLL